MHTYRTAAPQDLAEGFQNLEGSFGNLNGGFENLAEGFQNLAEGFQNLDGDFRILPAPARRPERKQKMRTFALSLTVIRAGAMQCLHQDAAIVGYS